MATEYVTLEKYRTITGDGDTADGRVQHLIAFLSARLRAETGMTGNEELSDDVAIMAESMVAWAVLRAVSAGSTGLGAAQDVTQQSLMANGFQAQVSYAQPTGSAYFRKAELADLRRLLGYAPRAAFVSLDSIGGA